MKLVFLVALVVLTAACGAYRFPSSSTHYGTVTGHVTAVPCSPVENPEPDGPCKALPGAGIAIEFSNDQGQSFVTKTAADGSYSIRLPVGTWRVTLKTLRLISGPSTVTVDADSTVVADYVVDSGIRMPVPAA
jgi:hypothetical protein